MSTIIFDVPMHLLGVPNASCSKQSAVSTEQENLSDYVRRVANEKGLTYREIGRRGGISSPSISDIISGKTRAVKLETLKALAKGLGVPEEELFDIARGKPPEPMTLQRFFAEMVTLGVEDFNAAKGITALTPADMEEILAVVRSTAQTMVEQKIKAKKKR